MKKYYKKISCLLIIMLSLITTTTTAQNLNMTGSCVIGTELLTFEGDTQNPTYNGNSVYFNSAMNLNYQSNPITTETYLYFALASELGTPEDRWVISYGGQPYYYFISNANSAPSGEYLPFDGLATTSDCGGSVFISSTCLNIDPLTGPTTPPARSECDVISIYGSEYANQPNVFFNPFGASTIEGDLALSDGTIVQKITNHQFSGIAVNAAEAVDVSTMTMLHIDVYSPNFTSMKIKLEGTDGSGVAQELDVPGGTTQCSWNSYDIPLSSFTAADLSILKWIVPITLDQAPTTLYLTNVYFYRPDSSIEVTSTTETICEGLSVALSATGATNYIWSPSTGLNQTSGATVVASPTETTVYTVSSTEVGACTKTVTVNVNPLPDVTIFASGPTTFCEGESVNLSVSGDGASLFFDGVNDYVQMGEFNLTADFTIETLFKSQNNTNAYLITNRHFELNQPGFWFTLGKNSNGFMFFEMSAAGSPSYVPILSNIQVSDDNWHHIAVTRQGTTITMYIDGVSVATYNDTFVRNLSKPDNIGRLGTGILSISSHYEGSMDEVRIWHVARSQTDIQNNMFNEIAASSVGLYNYYKMNEASGTTIFDATVTGNNGTLFNGLTREIPTTSPINNNNTILWSNNATTSVISNITESGTYSVQVTDQNGCSATSAITIVTVNPQPLIVGSAVESICVGESVTLEVTGASGYTWSPETGLNQSTGAIVIASPTETTVYTVTSNDVGACSKTVTVNVNPLPTTPLLSYNAPVCDGETLNLFAEVAPTAGYLLNSNSGVSFIDISLSGVPVTDVTDDSRHLITIPAFTFNAVEYTSALISNNGYFVFGSTSLGSGNFSNQTLPTGNFTSSGSDAAICAYWDDLYPIAGSSIIVETIGSLYIVQWNMVNQFSIRTDPETITFQMQLNLDNGQINIVYQDVFFDNATYDYGASATIGLNYNTTEALQYSFNTANLSNGQSVTFSPNFDYTYLWSGPNGFTSTAQNPSLANVTASANGTYSVQVSNLNGCSIESATLEFTVTPNQTYYADVDGDGFGDAAVSMLLCQPTVGYVLDNTDCDDSDENIYPGAPEVCYDGILQNCNGTLTDGCPPVLVNMIPSYCNTVLPYILSTVTAERPNLPAGTTETGYRFEITNLNTSEVRVIERPIRNFKLTMTDIYEYSTFYNVRVAVRVNAEWQPYGATCLMATPNIPTTQVVQGLCGTTLPLLFSTVTCNTVNSANQYRFRVENATNPLEVEFIERSVNNFKMTQLTLYPVQYNTTYYVSVQVRVVIDGAEVWSNSGAICNITTPTFPTSEVQLSQCELMATSNTQLISLNIFSGTSVYRVRLTNTTLAYMQTIDRTSPNFTLSMFAGLQAATTYTVAVSIQLNGVFGPYGKNCSITTPGALTRPVRENDSNTKEFSVIAFPNPFATTFALDVKTSSATDVNVSVYDMTGRLLEVRTAQAEDLLDYNLGDRYPSGVYNIVVNQGLEVKTVRVIKR